MDKVWEFHNIVLCSEREKLEHKSNEVRKRFEWNVIHLLITSIVYHSSQVGLEMDQVMIQVCNLLIKCVVFNDG